MSAFRFKRFTRKSYSIFNSMHKAVTIGVLSGCTLVSAHAAYAEPEERMVAETSLDTISSTELDEVVVTASRVGMPLNLAAKQVTIVTKQEIERSAGAQHRRPTESCSRRRHPAARTARRTGGHLPSWRIIRSSSHSPQRN